MQASNISSTLLVGLRGLALKCMSSCIAADSMELSHHVRHWLGGQNTFELHEARAVRRGIRGLNAEPKTLPTRRRSRHSEFTTTTVQQSGRSRV